HVASEHVSADMRFILDRTMGSTALRERVSSRRIAIWRSTDVEFVAAGQLILIPGESGEPVSLCDTTGRCVFVTPSTTERRKAFVSPNGKRAIIQLFSNESERICKLQLWNVEAGGMIAESTSFGDPVRLIFAPDSNCYVASDNQSTRVMSSLD